MPVGRKRRSDAYPIATGTSEVRGMRSILIADGCEEVADVFACLLARCGWLVTTFSNGWRAADALAGSRPFDAVLVSSRLHALTGVDLITKIRAMGHRTGVPIVMVTGTHDVAVVGAALVAGADDVLYKPLFDGAPLVGTLNKCIERRRL
jgi:DNA-binding response OmpR family regulator